MKKIFVFVPDNSSTHTHIEKKKSPFNRCYKSCCFRTFIQPSTAFDEHIVFTASTETNGIFSTIYWSSALNARCKCAHTFAIQSILASIQCTDIIESHVRKMHLHWPLRPCIIHKLNDISCDLFGQCIEFCIG